MTSLTDLLSAARQGDREAAGDAFGQLYDELRRLAHARLRRHQTMTLLDTTALVHESYLRLSGVQALPIADRQHFFSYASRVMRSVIVDFARARLAERRGGDANSAQPSWPAPVVSDAAIDEHQALDPSGAGRAPSP